MPKVGVEPTSGKPQSFIKQRLTRNTKRLTGQKLPKRQHLSRFKAGDNRLAGTAGTY